MYKFKSNDAESAIKTYLYKHPNSKVAVKALDGDCAAMLELYERLCGSIEQVVENGPSEEATDIIAEAVYCKYAPAMVRFAHDTMYVDDKSLPDGLMTLMEAYKLGSIDAMIRLQAGWHNCVKAIDDRHRIGEKLNKYEEFVLAFYYHYGIGISKNEALAQRLFQSLAKRGCDAAKKLLQEIQPGVIVSANVNV